MLQIFLIDGYFKGNQRQNHVLRQTQSTIYKKQSSNIDVFTFSGVKLPNSNFLRCDTNSRGSERSIKGLVRISHQNGNGMTYSHVLQFHKAMA